MQTLITHWQYHHPGVLSEALKKPTKVACVCIETTRMWSRAFTFIAFSNKTCFCVNTVMFVAGCALPRHCAAVNLLCTFNGHSLLSHSLPIYLIIFWFQWLHLQYGSSILAHPKMVSYSAAALSQVELRSMPLCCNALKESGCSLKVSSVFLSAPTNASVVQGEKVHPVPVPAHPQQLQYDIIIIKSPQLQ